MGKAAASTFRVYLDQYALSGYLNSSQFTLDQETPVVTTFSDAGPRRLVGNYDHSHEDNGFFDGVDNAVDEILHALVGDSADHYLGKCPDGDSENDIAYEAIVRLIGKPLSAAEAGAVLLNFSAAGAGGFSRGLVLGSKTSTGAENLTGRNMGATTAGQIFQAVFRLITFSGTNITMKLQESQNDGGDPYADITGLTSGALTAAGIVRVTTAAATEAWKRVNIAGTFSSALILVTAGLVD